MKRKVLITSLFVVIFCLLLAVGISAATTDEFGTPETLDNIDLTGMNTDTTARVVIKRADGEYYTYPSSYVVADNTTFAFSFGAISAALGESITKASVIRIEIPSNIIIMPKYSDTTPSRSSTLREIKFLPDSQLTTLSYGCFFQNTNMQRLNIPGTVKHIQGSNGTDEDTDALIISGSTIEELVFEDGFSIVPQTYSFTGAKGVKKVVFSNQMTTLGDWSFDYTLGESLQELYIGASMKDLGTRNLRFVKQSCKFYMPAQFLENVDQIVENHFTDYSGSLPTGVIFFTGTQEQITKLVQKSTYSKFICSSATLVEWDSTKADDEYMPSSGWTIVYGYNKCRAFYGNEHDEKVLNGCQFGCARNCGIVEMLENPVHDNQKMVTYGGSEDKNYYAEIKVCLGCVNCKAEISSISIDPLFTNKGYSTDLVGVGIVQGFTVNFDAVNDYIENVDSEFEYGLVASTFEGELISMENGTPVAKSGVISARIPNGSFKFLEIKLVGITEAHLDTNLVCCAYTVDNGEVFYMSNGATSKTATGKSYNQLKTNE